jgi:hypothetical protein
MRLTIKKILREEVEEKSSLKTKLQDLVDKIGMTKASKSVGGLKNLAKILYNGNNYDFFVNYAPELLNLRGRWIRTGISFSMPVYGLTMKFRHNSKKLFIDERFYKGLSEVLTDEEILEIINERYDLGAKIIQGVSQSSLWLMR